MIAGTTPGSNVGPCVDGVDVAQLLRDIGEASANQSTIELFRLCLGAQRVLAAVVGDRVAS